MAHDSDPPSMSVSELFRKDTREQLRNLWKKKADDPVMQAEFKRVDEKLKDLEEELDKGHQCLKEGELSKIVASVETATKLAEGNAREIKKSYQWSIRILAGLILFLITTGVGFVWYLAGMAFKLEAHDTSISRIQVKMDKIETEPQQIENMIDRAARRAAERVVRGTSTQNNNENQKNSGSASF